MAVTDLAGANVTGGLISIVKGHDIWWTAIHDAERLHPIHDLRQGILAGNHERDDDQRSPIDHVVANRVSP
jgi:hypothetical protein